ncbi:MAG: DNA repair protein RecO [Bacteroidales bacterium]|nr:MAG: DNA repair protein RecO [Bacteroidales bacterium]
MLAKTTGIVLHHIKYSDSSLIVTIYTEKFGRKSFIINNVRGRGSSPKANILQPLFLLELDVYFKLNRDIQRIKEFKNIVPFRTIPFNVIKSTVALFLAEILYKTIREEESNHKLFEFLYNSIQFFDITATGIPNFHIMFLLQLTKYLGFQPDINYTRQNRIFDLQNGNFVPAIPFHPHYIDESLSRILNKMLRINYKNLDSIKMTSEERYRLLLKILEYYQLHTESMGEIKSLLVLKEVFH